MPVLRTLAIIEINGIGFSEEACERLKVLMKQKLSDLETSCYQLAKRSFSLTSPNDIGVVLFVDLALPCNGNTESLRTTRNSKSHAKHFRTSKDVLEKLMKYHRLPKLILEWRRINSTLTKVVYPVQRKKSHIKSLSMYRVYCESQFHTCTGRVTFSEPNIQNVPKEFDVKISAMNNNMKKVRTELQHGGESVSPGEVHTVSMRSVFVPFEGGIFVTADYSQLELRIMAHLSSDSKLLHSINKSTDVFKSIASQINRVSVDEVTTLQRQQAKQICYGILYGIGIKSLAEQLGTGEEEASVYMENFKAKYNGVNRFIKKTIEECRLKGYVQTMSGRRRYLPAIHHKETHVKAQAERQAVNTAVQGSAADLVKTAMVKINAKLHEKFGNCCLKRTEEPWKQRGAFLVLQLHDELLYETNRKDQDIVVAIIKEGMENAYPLSVSTPVKIHVGNNWGMLKNVL